MAIATLIKDGQRIQAQDEADAQRLFSEGYTLEKSPPPGGAPAGAAPAGGQKSYLDYINEAFKAPEYAAAQKQYDEALSKLTQLQGQVPGFLDRKSAELEKVDPVLQKMMAQRAEQQGQLRSVEATSREKYSDIFDPIAREALIAQAVGNVTGKLAGSQGLIEQQRGFAGQKGQQALDALLAQAGLAETAVGAAGEKKDFLRDILGQSAQAEWTDKITKEAEQRQFENQKALILLQNSLKGSGLTDKDQRGIKDDMVADLDLMGEAIKNRQITREQALDELVANYDELDKETISKIVYTRYGDQYLSPIEEPSADGGILGDISKGFAPIESGISPWDVIKQIPAAAWEDYGPPKMKKDVTKWYNWLTNKR